MVSENLFVALSGTNTGFAGSHCVNMALLFGKSGNGFYPLMVNEIGYAVTLASGA